MNAVMALAAGAGARLAPRAGSLSVDIFKTAAGGTFLGLFMPHKYQLEVVQCDKAYHRASMVIDTPSEVEFLLVMLREQAEKHNLDFMPRDHTKEFPRLVA